MHFSICALFTSAASICCLMSEGSTPGSSSSLTMSWESLSVLSSAATSAQNLPARSKTSVSFPSRSSARCRISSHRERRRRRRDRTAGRQTEHQHQHGGRGMRGGRKTGKYLLVSFLYCCPLILKTLVNENDKASFVYFLLESALSSSDSHYPCTLQSFISGQQEDGALHRRT